MSSFTTEILISYLPESAHGSEWPLNSSCRMFQTHNAISVLCLLWRWTGRRLLWTLEDRKNTSSGGGFLRNRRWWREHSPLKSTSPFPSVSKMSMTLCTSGFCWSSGKDMNSSTLRDPELSRSSFLNLFPNLLISSASTETHSLQTGRDLGALSAQATPPTITSTWLPAPRPHMESKRTWLPAHTGHGYSAEPACSTLQPPATI